MPFDIEKFKTLSPEAQQIVFDKKNISLEAQRIIRQKIGEIGEPGGPITTGEELEEAQIREAGREEIRGIIRIQAAKERAIEEAPEVIGGIGGGLIGAPIGQAGAIAGAGLGGAAGKAYQQLYKRISGKEVPETALEAAKEIGISGARQAAFEAGGRLVIGTAGKILAPFSKTVTPEAKIAQETLNKYMPKETSKLRVISRLKGERIPSVLPAEATENRTLDLLENISEASLIGGKKIADFKNIIRPKAINNMVDDLVNTFGKEADPDMIGEAFVMAVEKRLKPSRLVATTLYNTVDELVKPLTKQIPVTKQVQTSFLDVTGKPIMKEITEIITQEPFSTLSLKNFVKPLVIKAREIGSIEAKNAGDDLVMAINNLPDNISYGAIQDLRSRLISRVDEFLILNKKAPAIGKAKKLIGITDSIIGTTLKKENPEALALWRQANKLYKEGSKQFNNQFIRRLIKESIDKGNPEVIAEKIFKPRAISNIRKTKAAIDEGTWKQLKGWHVQNILKKSTNTEGELTGKTFWNQMFGKAGMGEQTMKEIYKPHELKALKDTAIALKVIQKKQGEGIGRMWIQLTQAGAIVGLMDERSRPFSMVVLGAPIIMSRLFTNPIAAKWLIQGAKLPAKSPQAGAILTKLSDLAFKIEREMKISGELKPTTEEIQQLKGETTLR